MRIHLLALMVVTACAQPRRVQPVEQRPSDWSIEKEPARSVEAGADAGVDATGVVAVADAASSPSADVTATVAVAESNRRSVRDVLEHDGATIGGDRKIDTNYPAVSKPFYVMRARDAIAGLTITAVPSEQSWFFWTIRIQNASDKEVTVNWDRSSFVGRTGKSEGRLVRGETRKMDAARTQPPTTVPARARIEQVVIPEGFIALAELLSTPDRTEPMPALMFPGARLVLSIEQGGATRTWTGQFVPASNGFYCPERGMCVRSSSDCAGKCRFVKKAWCMSNKCVSSNPLCAELLQQFKDADPDAPHPSCIEIE